MKEKPNNSKPIFIVGMNGSGTTMLLDCLNNHPVLYGFMRETKIIPYYIKYIKKFGDLNNDKNFLSLFNEFRHLSLFRYTNNGNPTPLPENWHTLPRNLASIVDSVFSYYATQAGKERWCEKTPMHTQHILALAKLFPEAKFIHIIRDGRSCAASFYRRFKYTPELTMYRWKNVVREARRQGHHVEDRYFEIRYEDLTSFPEKKMREICNFLDISYDSSILYISRKRTSTGSTAEKIQSNVKPLKNILTSAQIKNIEKIGGKLLAELNYDTNCDACDHDPHWFIIKFWLYCGYLKRGIHELKRPRKNKWDDLTAIITRAIKQRLVSKY